MSQKTILCYGDSNTWGYVPSADKMASASRFPRSERWTGKLQTLLGDGFYVVEEGLNSRTTNLNYQYPPDRNGKTYLPSCLYSHAPIDLVVLALGGNDLKTYFNRNPEDIKNGLAELVDIIQMSKYGPGMQVSPQVLILSSPIPLPIFEEVVDENGIYFFKGAIEKAQALVRLFADLAKEKSCYYLDTSKDIIPSQIDGVHFAADTHKKLAQMVCDKIKSIFLSAI